MITFKKENHTESRIFWHGEHIGWLEKPYGTYYEAEIYYTRVYFPANKKALVVPTLRKICERLHARKYREFKKLELLRDSIINKEFIVKD